MANDRWCPTDTDLLRYYMRNNQSADWKAIAQAIGHGAGKCRRVAMRYGMLAPTPPQRLMNRIARIERASAIEEPSPLPHDVGHIGDEETYIARLMALGGFCRAEIHDGSVVHVYPR